MAEYLKVTDHPGLVRDTESNAILNTDIRALNKYREEREKLLKMKSIAEEHEKMKNDISRTREEISQIKDLLVKVLEKK
jgi:hypothetical protein